MTRDEFTAEFAERLDALCQFTHDELEKIITAQLEAWSLRYSRHTFSAAVGHGRLMLTAEPIVNHRADLDMIDSRFPIQKEAESLIDFFNGFDRENIGPGHMEWITR